ncbi:MAG TPA: YoaK family protein [Polyangiaceae bacterium]|nr:YoaK family protein [Polyangiaceae bacterium]
MFSREGSARSDWQNRLLAAYLAFIGGFVNSCGFVLVGTFTSHVTGNVGRLADDTALGNYAAAGAALTMIFAFFCGAFLVSMMVETTFFRHKSRAYAAALALEGGLLVAFTAVSFFVAPTHPRWRDAEALLLCTAMGLQNALVTRLSGAVVRTTHLTGVVTDLGIEMARWFRHWRGSLSGVVRVRLVVGSNAPERPAIPKMYLLTTIALAFLFGAGFGAVTAVRLGHAAMLVAAVAVAAGALYANSRGQRLDTDDALSRR